MNILTQAGQNPDPNKLMQPQPPAQPAGTVASTYDVKGAAGPMQGPTEMKVEDNMLASKQLDSILSRDNPLMQKARARAQMAANRRGLLNSTMAAQAGESAVIDAAMPLAQQDANTNLQVGQTNVNTKNQFTQDENRFGRDVAMARFGALTSSEERAADRQFQSGENILERNFRSGEAALDRQQQVRMQEMGQKFQMDFEKFKLPMNMMASFTDKMQTYVSEVMRDPNMDAAAKDQAIANYYNYSQQQMGWMSTFFGQAMPNMQGGANITPGGAAPGAMPPASVGVPPATVASPTVSTPSVISQPAGPVAQAVSQLPVRLGGGSTMRRPIVEQWGAFR